MSVYPLSLCAMLSRNLVIIVQNIIYIMHYADFETMCEILSHVDWHDSLTPLSIHEAWEFILMILWVSAYP